MISLMTAVRVLGLLCSLVIIVPAQIAATGPGFDPTPVTIPAVPRSSPRPITSKDLIEMRDFKGFQISPDGHWVAYVVSQALLETNSYRSALFVISTKPGSTPVNLGSAGPPHWDEIGQYLEIAPQWSPDSQYITYLLKDDGIWQVWRWRPDGGKPEQLTHNRFDVQSYEWSPDGSQIIYSVTDPAPVEEAKSSAAQGILWDGSVRAYRAKPIFASVIDKMSKKTELWVFEAANRIERKATTEEQSDYQKAHQQNKDAHNLRTVKTSPDGKAIAYLDTLYDIKKFPYLGWALFSKRREGEEPIQLLAPSTLPITDFWWNKDGNEVYFSRVTDDGRIALFAIPAAGGQSREVTKSRDQLYSFSFDKDLKRAACIRKNATLPDELDVVDVRSGDVHTLVTINPEFQNLLLSPATRLEWTNKYGEKAFGHLIKPLNYEAGKRYPLIVTTYTSWGFLRGGVGDEYPVQVFAANGYAVLSFNVPPAHPLDPQNVRRNLLEWYSPMASLETGIRQLETMGVIDPRRTGLTGLSYGAEITEFTISHSNIFQAAAVSGSSARDPLFYYLAPSSWHKIFADWLGGWPEGQAAPVWREISPALNAKQVNAPLLIQAPDTEYLLSLQFYNALKEYGKNVDMFVFPDEEHIKNQPQHKYAVYQRNLDWFNFWLQGKEDSNPRKQEQYDRWRAMKEGSSNKIQATSH
jgi:dipeptidyl aminopeptidase/acylaminoacyl peptidase